jgi:acetyl-CoA/propionyl-CoA carboxylase biotin carboxyl carrier protein
MENEIFAHKAGTIAELAVQEGGAVRPGDTIAVIKSSG